MDQPKYRRFIPPNTALLYRDVISSIFHAILEGQLRPGERLAEEAIAQELGVSRSPIRQALQEMERQGVVVIIPRKGACVANWTVDDIEDFIDVRVGLEKQAAEYASERITQQDINDLYSLVDKMIEAAKKQSEVDQEIHYDLAFHRRIVMSSRNNTLIQIYGAIELRTQMYMIYEKYLAPAIDLRLGLTQAHIAIVDALKERNQDLAKIKIEESIRLAADAFLKRMRKLESLNADGSKSLPPLDRYKTA